MGKKGKKPVRQQEKLAQAAEGKRKQFEKDKKKKEAVLESRRDAPSIDSDPAYLKTHLHSKDRVATEFEAWKVEEWFVKKRRGSIGGGMLDWWTEDDNVPPKKCNSVAGEISDGISDQGIERFLMEMTVNHNDGQMSLKLMTGLPALSPVPTLVPSSSPSSRTMSPEPRIPGVGVLLPGPGDPKPGVVPSESSIPGIFEPLRNDSAIPNTADIKLAAGKSLPENLAPHNTDPEFSTTAASEMPTPSEVPTVTEPPTASEPPSPICLPPDRAHNNWDWRVVHGNASYCSDRTWFGENFKELHGSYGPYVEGVGTVYLDLFRCPLGLETAKVKLENVYYVPDSPCHGALVTDLLNAVAAAKYEQHPFRAKDGDGQGLIWSVVDEIGRSRLTLPKMSSESLIVETMKFNNGEQHWMLDIIIKQVSTAHEAEIKTTEPQAVKQPQAAKRKKKKPKSKRNKATQDLAPLGKTQDEPSTENAEKTENGQNSDSSTKLMSKGKETETRHSLDSEKKRIAKTEAEATEPKVTRDVFNKMFAKIKELESMEKINDLVNQQHTALREMEKKLVGVPPLPYDLQKSVDNIRSMMAGNQKPGPGRMEKKREQEALLTPAAIIAAEEAKIYESEKLQSELQFLESRRDKATEGSTEYQVLLTLIAEVKLDQNYMEDEAELEKPLGPEFLRDLEASRLLRETRALQVQHTPDEAGTNYKRARYDAIIRRLTELELTIEVEGVVLAKKELEFKINEKETKSKELESMKKALETATINLDTMTPDALKELGIQKTEKELETLQLLKGKFGEYDRMLMVKNTKKRLENMRESKEPFSPETVVAIDAAWVTRELALMPKLSFSSEGEAKRARQNEEQMKKRLAWLKEKLVQFEKAKICMTVEEVKKIEWATQTLQIELERLEQRKGNLRGAHLETILKQIEEVKEAMERLKNLKEPLVMSDEINLELQRLHRQMELVSTASWTAEAKALKLAEFTESVDDVVRAAEVLDMDCIREAEVKQLTAELAKMDTLKELAFLTKHTGKRRRERLAVLEAELAESREFWNELCSKSDKPRFDGSVKSQSSNDS